MKDEHYRKYPNWKWSRSGKKLSSSNSKSELVGPVDETVARPQHSGRFSDVAIFSR